MLGRIIGKATTNGFSFEIKSGEKPVEEVVKKFDYIKVMHKVYGFVLCQVIEIEVTSESKIAKCAVIGFKDKKTSKIKKLKIPFDIGSEIFIAEDELIKEIIALEDSTNGAYIGNLEGKNIPVYLDLQKVLTKHLAVLAKSGAGKSYTVGVLLEEILEKKIPILIIDTHGEYSGLSKENNYLTDEQEAIFNIKKTKYLVKEYGDPNNYKMLPLRLPNNLSQQELVHIIPGKLNNTQLGLLYSSIRGLKEITFENVILGLEQEESNAKWSIINIIEHIRSLNIFSTNPVQYNELLKPGLASIINLKGFSPEIQQMIVYKLAKDLFELRKVNKIPPFFLVIEEAHNYCPERSYGETTSSKILRTIASEGRKFGLGLAVISQRPARIDKSVLSQCTTQIILKMTNPNDLKAVINSVEGITNESYQEIQNLSIGTALVTGVTDTPLFINVRPRKTMHGGHAVNMLEIERSEENQSGEKSFVDVNKDFEEQELLPIITPTISEKDLLLMSDEPDNKVIRRILVPAYQFVCKDKEGEFKLLFDMNNNSLVIDIDDYKTAKLPEFNKLSKPQIKLLQTAYKLKVFDQETIMGKSANNELDDDLQVLVDLGYLILEGENYSITNNYVLSRLRKIANFSMIDYKKIDFSEKLITNFELDKVKEQLSSFTTILDQQECNILKYEVVDKEEVKLADEN